MPNFSNAMALNQNVEAELRERGSPFYAEEVCQEAFDIDSGVSLSINEEDELVVTFSDGSTYLHKLLERE